MAAGDKRRKHTPVAQILYTETEPHRRNAAVSGFAEDQGASPAGQWRNR
jgi:hypothetical protein